VIIAPILQPVVADEKPEPATEQEAAPQVTEQISEEVAVETSAVTSEPQEEMAEVGDAPVAEAPVSADTDVQPEADTPTEVAALPEVPNEQAATAPALGAVILSGPEGVKVLQSGGQATPTEQDFVALDAITYGDDGAVEVSGRATSGSQVNVYLNNALSANSQADRAGAWSVRLDDVAVGTYTLRMDSVDETGKVLARIESPFRREDQQTLIAATPQTQGARAKAVTVQPGNTLWAIAREQFGDGVAYVRLFEANRDLIRDPDLIYPGQVFAIPE
jgi:nucleoid-associated protein YgaU